VLKPTTFAALGTNTAGNTITAGGTLDFAAFIVPDTGASGFASTPWTIAGDGAGIGGVGAIINSGLNSQLNALQNVNLAANA